MKAHKRCKRCARCPCAAVVRLQGHPGWPRGRESRPRAAQTAARTALGRGRAAPVHAPRTPGCRCAPRSANPPAASNRTPLPSDLTRDRPGGRAGGARTRRHPRQTSRPVGCAVPGRSTGSNASSAHRAQRSGVARASIVGCCAAAGSSGESPRSCRVRRLSAPRPPVRRSAAPPRERAPSDAASTPAPRGRGCGSCRVRWVPAESPRDRR